MVPNVGTQFSSFLCSCLMRQVCQQFCLQHEITVGLNLHNAVKSKQDFTNTMEVACLMFCVNEEKKRGNEPYYSAVNTSNG